jgi:predicted RNA-binding protein with PIN domain
MGQHTDKVEQRRIEIEAEEWASKVYMIHAYTNDEKQNVFDVQYNDGKIVREIDGKKTTIYPNGQKESRKSYIERIRHMFSAAKADIKAGFEPR